MEETIRNQVIYKVCQILINAIEKDAAENRDRTCGGEEKVAILNRVFRGRPIRNLKEICKSSKTTKKKNRKHSNYLSITSEYAHTTSIYF